jgi:hypothetical protein
MAAMTGAERQRRYLERLKAGEKRVKYRKPQDRRSRGRRWADAVEMLRQIAEEVRAHRDGMPPGIAESPFADELEAFANMAEDWLEGVPDYPER